MMPVKFGCAIDNKPVTYKLMIKKILGMSKWGSQYKKILMLQILR